MTYFSMQIVLCFCYRCVCFTSLNLISLFQINAIILDGASSNLAMIKELCGHGRGVFGSNNEQRDPHAIQPWFTNPAHPEEDIFMIICPTHQVKKYMYNNTLST